MTDEKRLFRAIHSKRKEEPEATFNYIYVKYKPLVTFIVAQYIKNDADVEDIVQDSFIEFFKDVEHLRSTIKSYLTTSSKHNALDFLKKNKKISLVDIDTLDYLADENSTNEQRLLANEKFNSLIIELNAILSKEEVCTTVVCNYFVNNGLSRLKIPHTYGTMILEKYLCKQLDE